MASYDVVTGAPSRSRVRVVDRGCSDDRLEIADEHVTVDRQAALTELDREQRRRGLGISREDRKRGAAGSDARVRQGSQCSLLALLHLQRQRGPARRGVEVASPATCLPDPAELPVGAHGDVVVLVIEVEQVKLNARRCRRVELVGGRPHGAGIVAAAAVQQSRHRSEVPAGLDATLPAPVASLFRAPTTTPIAVAASPAA